MLLHANPDCPHNDSSLTPIRLLCYRGAYQDALAAVDRLDWATLSWFERNIAILHRHWCELALGRCTIDGPYAHLTAWHKQLCEERADPGFIADLRSYMVLMTASFAKERPEVSLQLLTQFLDGLPEEPFVRVHYLLMLGHFTRKKGDIASALHLYKWATEIVGDDRPCLREMALRHYALSLHRLGEEVEARKVLAGVLSDRLSYEDLLVVPEV